MDHFCLRGADCDEQTLLEIFSVSGVEGQAAGDLYGAQGVRPSIYFADPEGNRVELKRSK
jgi:glyoxylase I family protein